MAPRLGIHGEGLVTKKRLSELSADKTAKDFGQMLYPSSASGGQDGATELKIMRDSHVLYRFVCLVLPSFVIAWDDADLYIFDRNATNGNRVYKYTKKLSCYEISTGSVDSAIETKLKELSDNSAVAKVSVVVMIRNLADTVMTQIEHVSQTVAALSIKLNLLYMFVSLLLGLLLLLGHKVLQSENMVKDELVFLHKRVDMSNQSYNIQAQLLEIKVQTAREELKEMQTKFAKAQEEGGEKLDYMRIDINKLAKKNAELEDKLEKMQTANAQLALNNEAAPKNNNEVAAPKNNNEVAVYEGKNGDGWWWWCVKAIVGAALVVLALLYIEHMYVPAPKPKRK